MIRRVLRFVAIMATTVVILAGATVLIVPQASRLVSAHRSDHEQISLNPLAERSPRVNAQRRTDERRKSEH